MGLLLNFLFFLVTVGEINVDSPKESFKKLFLFVGSKVIFPFFEFYSLDYKNFLGPIDVHHEGTFLTAQLNYFSKNQIWTGTFFDYGFLGNSIGMFSHSIFDDYSIGIQRFFFKSLILLTKVLIILICRTVIIIIHFPSKKEILFLIFK